MTSVRGHGEGSLFRRKRDGKLIAAVTMRDGRRLQRSADSKREQAANLRALLRMRDEGVEDPRGLRVGTYLQRWSSELNGLAPATIRQHRMIVRVHLVPAFERTYLTQLTPSDVDRYLRRTDLDPQTRRHHRATLRRALQDALRDGLVSRNVAALSDVPARLAKDAER